MATTCTLMRQSLGLITTEMVASVVAGVEVSVVEEEGEVTGAEVVAADVTEDGGDVDLEEGVEGVTEAVAAGAHHTSRVLVQLVQVNSTFTSQV